MEVRKGRRGETYEIAMVTLWDSWDAIRAFAGDPIRQCVERLGSFFLGSLKDGSGIVELSPLSAYTGIQYR